MADCIDNWEEVCYNNLVAVRLCVRSLSVSKGFGVDIYINIPHGVYAL